MIFDSSSGETTSHGEILLSNLIFVAGIRAAINGNSINLKQTRVTDVRNDVLSKERGDETVIREALRLFEKKGAVAVSESGGLKRNAPFLLFPFKKQKSGEKD